MLYLALDHSKLSRLGDRALLIAFAGLPAMSLLKEIRARIGVTDEWAIPEHVV